MTTTGRQIRVWLDDNSVVEGWDFGETPLGQYVAQDREARNIRFVPRGLYRRTNYEYGDVIDVESAVDAFYARAGARRHDEAPPELAEAISHALDRTDFNEVRRLHRTFEELQHRFTGSYEALELRTGPEEAAPEPADKVLQVRDAHRRLLEEVDRSGVLAVLIEHGELILAYPLPQLDWVASGRFDESLLLEAMCAVARERPALPRDGGRAMLDQVEAAAIVDGLREEQPEKPPDGSKSRWPRRLRLIAAAGKIATGGNLATANIGVGLIAGVASALPTLGLGAIAGVVGVATSAYTGLNAAFDGVKDLATALESS
jgi:hypothetical protein